MNDHILQALSTVKGSATSSEVDNLHKQLAERGLAIISGDDIFALASSAMVMQTVIDGMVKVLSEPTMATPVRVEAALLVHDAWKQP